MQATAHVVSGNFRTSLLSLTLLLAAFAAHAAEGDARVWLSTDFPVTFTLDGNEGNLLEPGSLALLVASPGRHVIEATESGGKDRTSVTFELLRGEHRTIQLDLATPMAARLLSGPAPAASDASAITKDMRPPRLIHRVDPAYPAEARAARIAGEVVLETIVDATGGVSVTRILRSQPPLDAAALRAVSKWRYAPARIDGLAKAVILTVKIDFNLE